jgi:hypothetical protein
MIIIHKHGRLESLPRQDLSHNSNSSLEAFNLSMLISLLQSEGFYDFSIIKFLQQVLDKNLSPSSL